METIYILSVIVFLILLFIWGNMLVFLRIKKQTAKALKDLEDQILNKIRLAVEIVKEAGKYISYEKDLMNEILQAKRKADGAKTLEEKKEAGSMVSAVLDSVFKVSEKYPDLKTSKKFMDLKLQLKDIEDGINSARKLYLESLESLKKIIKAKPFSTVFSFFDKKEEKPKKIIKKKKI
ncbi:MAG: LemA family protein [Candidatus Pacebacteria bacterium]|nr:LemA family protein [Candidatus Paceibacterota bacterium]